MQYSPYYKGHELVFPIQNMDVLSKQFRLSMLLHPTPKEYRKFVNLEVASPSQPRPWLRCAVCLYRLGFGYDRIARYIGVERGPRAKNKLSNYIKKRRSRGLVKPPLKPRIKTPKPPPISPEQKIQKSLSTKTQLKAKLRLRAYFSQWLHQNLYPMMTHIIGCDQRFFRHWISSQFTKGMSWDNHGTKWHIDHRIPCKAFDLTNHLQVAACYHFSNLCPLCAKNNLRKSASIEPTQNELLLKF